MSYDKIEKFLKMKRVKKGKRNSSSIGLDISHTFQKALRFHEKGDLEKALQHYSYTRTYDHGHDFHEVHVRIGRLHCSLGNKWHAWDQVKRLHVLGERDLARELHVYLKHRMPYEEMERKINAYANVGD